MADKKQLNFIANARLKDVVGRDLINDDNIAIIELIKNSKDAGSKNVGLRFGHVPEVDSPPTIIIEDSGKGMSEEDIRFKWLNIAYSEKKGKSLSKSESYAGNKGIGRFACDRLGEELVLYTRVRNGDLLRLEIDWTKFEVDDQKSEIGRIKTTLEVIDSKRLKDETGLVGFSHGTVLHVKQLRETWTKEKLLKLRRQLEKFVIDPNKSFGVSLVADDHLDTVDLNGAVENKIFEKLEFRTTSIQSEIDAKGGSIVTKLVHDGDTLFTLTEKNPYGALKKIKASIYFLNQPAKVFFKFQTGYRSINFGSMFLFLNGFRVLPYGAEADDWLGLDRRKQQGQRRFFGTRDLVGYIDVRDDEGVFKAVSSREGLVSNRAFQELTSQSQDVPSVLGDTMEYGFFHKICRKLEKFVVEGLDWDSIKTDVTDEDMLLDPKTYEYSTDKQKVIECLESIISIRTSSEHVEELDVNFRNVIRVAKDEAATYEELVENLQGKFEGTSVGQLTPAEKRDLSKFVERQSKEIAAKEETSKRLDQKLNVETKRRLFAEFESSTDVDRILKMHHQTRLLAGQAFKTLNDTIRRYRVSPEKWTSEQLVEIMEQLLLFGNEGGMDGNQLIQQIRDSDHVYLPVIFYSSGGIEPLMAAVQEQRLDGVYLTGRDQLFEKAKTVITSLLRKEQTIKQTRGLLMEGVSEIDAKFGTLFALIWTKLKEDQKTVVMNYFHEKIKKQKVEVDKKVNSFPLDVAAFWKEMSENFVSPAYLTSTRWKVLKKALDSLKVDDELRRIFSEFHSRQDGETPIVTLRNLYGHKTRQQLTDNHTAAQCIAIRRELRRQQGNLDAIVDLLE